MHSQIKRWLQHEHTLLSALGLPYKLLQAKVPLPGLCHALSAYPASPRNRCMKLFHLSAWQFLVCSVATELGAPPSLRFIKQPWCSTVLVLKSHPDWLCMKKMGHAAPPTTQKGSCSWEPLVYRNMKLAEPINPQASLLAATLKYSSQMVLLIAYSYHLAIYPQACCEIMSSG